MSNSQNKTKVIVPCRFSYLHCWEPDAINGGEPKYSVSAIIPKSDTKTIEQIKAAIEQAKKDSVSKWGGKIPANLKLPLRDGDIDRPEDEAYAGCYFFNANSRQAPEIVDAQVQPILNQSEVYSGCYGSVLPFMDFQPTETVALLPGLAISRSCVTGTLWVERPVRQMILRQKQMRISSLDRNTGGRRLPPAT